MNSKSWLPLIGAVVLSASLVVAASHDSQLKAGAANLKSAGVLAFGPDGVLFVGDSSAGAIYALDTADAKAGSGKVNVEGINVKVAAMLGSAPDQIMINDVAVNPISKNAYLSVSRGRGPDATPVILRVDTAGKIGELDLGNIKHSKAMLPNAPDADAKDRRGRSLRAEAITDIHYVDGQVFVAGLSNEEFASNLRSIPFPFETVAAGSSVEIFHGAHGRWETNSPVRTFVPYSIKSESHLLAAYTCTPLVKFPVSQLKPGTKVVGTTIAELGNHNRPLDMIVYNKAGQDYILMNNSSRGVMRMSTDRIETYDPITAKTDVTGLPYETLDQFKGVQQLAQLDDLHALLLVQTDAGAMNLETIALP